MSSGDTEKQPDEQEAQEPKPEQKPEHEATEGGFGTGLRAQLQKRRGEQAEEPQEADAPKPQEPPLVRVDLYTSAPHQINGAETSAEAEELRTQLAEAQKRERELRAAFAEQVEAYERKLSEEYDVSREQTKLDELGSKLANAESAMRKRGQKLAADRQEPDAEH